MKQDSKHCPSPSQSPAAIASPGHPLSSQALNLETLNQAFKHKGDSRAVSSNQGDLCHKNLDKLVARHNASSYQKPLQDHNLKAFKLFQQRLATWLGGSPHEPKLILDSCCGTGMSSYHLARQFPQHLIVGLDQSAHRLEKDKQDFKAEAIPENLLLLRANCEDFWRLCLEQSISFDLHCILYPNPWPKSAHLARRWHGHPVFPVLPQLAANTIVRSNWLVYLQEFGRAWQLVCGQVHEPESIQVEQAFTLFEKKYQNSGQDLYELKLGSSCPELRAC